MKVVASEHDGETYVRYSCPGCKHEHTVPAKRWHWNGDVNKPTLSPSVRHFYVLPAHDGRPSVEVTTCHYHVRNGIIEYCNDCEHDLKGQKVELPELQSE